MGRPSDRVVAYRASTPQVRVLFQGTYILIFSVTLIKTTNERRLVQGHETPLRVKRDIEDVSSELDNGG
ncbi:hypothetical protein TNCV_4692221 [Trichonephila clavipes]|nr:hypothetical protein TNCV_4692221 [Trichonephila clavipes]